MKNLVVRFAHDESGSAAVQFGLFAVSLLIATIVAARYIGAKMTADFQEVSRKLEIAKNRGNDDGPASELDSPAKDLALTAMLMRRATDARIANEHEASPPQKVA